MYTSKKVKHNKLKNTGIIFELLTRQLTSDILNNKESKAIDIIKEFFAKNSNLSKELGLYQTLIKTNKLDNWKAKELLETVIAARKTLVETSLDRDKYNLIKRIKAHYDLNDFFKHKVNDYKVQASIYKLFEFKSADSPVQIFNAKCCILEHIQKVDSETPNAQSLLESEFGKEDKDVRTLAYKYLLEKFNDKYKGLDDNQKQILKLYITQSPEQNQLLEYVRNISSTIQKDIRKYSNRIDEQVIKIKLQEVSNLLEELKSTKTVKDSDVLSIMRYFELLKEIKKVEA